MATTGAVSLTRGQQLVERVIGPSPLTRAPLDKMGETPLLVEEPCFPKASWTGARYNKQHGRAFPQAIAHRGYKARYPENTMAAFEGAVRAGAHAIETDTHLTRDGVVVLSHDATLTRCFGRAEKLIDLEWEQLRGMETTAEPKQGMARLSDLLDYLARPGLEEVWVLLDIKLDNDADELIRRIAHTIHSTPPSAQRAWRDRLVLGVWATKYIPLCAQHLPGFPMSHIGFSTRYAAQFLQLPNVSFNMLHAVLVGPFGARLVARARRARRPVFAWTVNDERDMRWCVGRDLDAVISDDPARFLAICDDWLVESGRPSWGVGQLLTLLRINLLAFAFGIMFRIKFGSGLAVPKRRDRDGAQDGGSGGAGLRRAPSHP